MAPQVAQAARVEQAVGVAEVVNTVGPMSPTSKPRQDGAAQNGWAGVGPVAYGVADPAVAMIAATAAGVEYAGVLAGPQQQAAQLPLRPCPTKLLQPMLRLLRDIL
mmetsp:Transcript_42615/g.84344  ORF Transcript_42615/g.84344 Transcript_42615/m.84344 type:complete len:106 (-) Transcript_42615:69-386(-)